MLKRCLELFCLAWSGLDSAKKKKEKGEKCEILKLNPSQRGKRDTSKKG